MEVVESPPGLDGDDPATPPAKEPRDRRRLLAGVELCIVALLAAGVLLVGLKYSEGRHSAGRPATAGADVTDGLLISARVESIDPIRNELTIRLAVVPFGSYGDTSFTKPVTILTGTSHGLTTTDIKDGSPITSSLVTTSLDESQITDYPFDRYKSILVLKIAVPAGGAGEPAVPTQLDVGGLQHGYKITASPELASR